MHFINRGPLNSSNILQNDLNALILVNVTNSVNKHHANLFQSDVSTYGVDPLGTLPEESEEEGVVVPQTVCPLDSNSLLSFKERMSGVQGEDNWDIAPYLHAIDIINQLKT